MKASQESCRALVRIAIATLIGVSTPGLCGASPATVKAAAKAAVRIAPAEPTDTWAVRLPAGADPVAAAAAMGAENLGRVPPLADTYLFRTVAGKASPKVGAAGNPGASPLWMERQVARRYFPRAWNTPTDSLFGNQWHLVNTGQSGGTAGVDVNVLTPVWDTDELSGNGVVIGIVDDGLQHTHPDLTPNYRAALSYDFNDDDADPSPATPNPFTTTDDSHGTAAAGVAAASMDGASCGIGVAYGAGLAGIRLIAAPITDAQIATAISHERDAIHVYSNSWGPGDFADDLNAAGTLTEAALAANVAIGRGGLGSIYAWAAGNGGANGDNVNYDGVASSRYTIAVGAVDHDGTQSWYSEPGASLMLVAPSSGDGVGITTTDLAGVNGYNTDAAAADGGDCTGTFGGTSSATPVVSGVVALMLEANPNLSWRDVQHILVQTARRNDASDGDWVANGAGYFVNHKYGFGLVDAAAAVAAAAAWTGVGSEVSWSSPVATVGTAIPEGSGTYPATPGYGTAVVAEIEADADIDLEHVEVVFNATHPFRGDLKVVLVSPDGTESVLAEAHGDTNADYAWTFRSVRHWGEASRGTWTLRVSDGWEADMGTFDSWQLVLHGTASPGGTIGGDGFGTGTDDTFGSGDDTDFGSGGDDGFDGGGDEGFGGGEEDGFDSGGDTGYDSGDDAAYDTGADGSGGGGAAPLIGALALTGLWRRRARRLSPRR